MKREATHGDAQRVAFAGFVLDRAARQLLRDGEERHLEPKAFELLSLLLARRPNAVAKSEIHDQLWPDTFVSESNLTGLVAQVRQALGEPRRPVIIRTVHGFGYAFAAPATDQAGKEIPAAEVTPPTAAPSRPAMVRWEERSYVLQPGENVLGRSDGVSVHIEHPGISRRHARIVLRGREALLEDLGSKNGTFLREERISGPMPLADGDYFRLGRLLLLFQSPRETVPTRTEVED